MSEPITHQHQQIADEEDTHQEENMKQLLEAIETLSPVNKAVILLYLENLQYEEIAHITGLTKSNVSVRLVRIKRELEKRIGQHSNTSKETNHG